MSCYLSASQCEEQLGNTVGETNALTKAASLFLQVQSYCQLLLFFFFAKMCSYNLSYAIYTSRPGMYIKTYISSHVIPTPIWLRIWASYLKLPWPRLAPGARLLVFLIPFYPLIFKSLS